MTIRNAAGLYLPASPGFVSQATFTPTAAAYGAVDVMDTIKTFSNIGPALGGEVKINSATLMVAHTAVIASEGAYVLHLFSAALATPIADNGVFDIVAAERSLYLGKIDFTVPIDLGSTLWVQINNINMQITVPAGGAVYGHLVTTPAFTPTAAARIVTVHTEPVHYSP